MYVTASICFLANAGMQATTEITASYASGDSELSPFPAKASKTYRRLSLCQEGTRFIPDKRECKQACKALKWIFSAAVTAGAVYFIFMELGSLIWQRRFEDFQNHPVTTYAIEPLIGCAAVIGCAYGVLVLLALGDKIRLVWEERKRRAASGLSLNVAV